MKILIMGAYGQVGLELIRSLSKKMPIQNIFSADIKEPPTNMQIKNHLSLNALDKEGIYSAIKKHKITQMYCLTALLSATGEANPMKTDEINMQALFNTLQAARQLKLDRVFWPSSIAAFGNDTPKQTDQQTIMNPSTVYGITKKSGQLWCAYYAKRFGVDVRSVRYPGLVGYRSLPGGGTTDYAVDIFHKALKGEVFECNLAENAYLPMVYTDDAIDGSIKLMEAPKQNISVRTSYNIHGMTFCPSEIAAQIKKHIPSFKIQYKVDPVLQKISETWPHTLKDNLARKDWGWSPKFDLAKMTKEILDNLKV